MFSVWSPPADVLTSGNRWLVKIELAGVRLDGLEISAQHKELYVRGCRYDQHCTAGYSYQSLEIRYSHFERRINFPFVLDNADISWQYVDGLLLIHILRK